MIYPLFWSTLPHGKIAGEWIKPHGLFGELLTVLKKHTQTLLTGSGRGEGFNVFADGGLKLSSTSNNSWMSKIAIVQHVMREVFEMQKQPEIQQILQHADAAHVRWTTEGESAYWAMSDQFVSGVAMGSKYYPRIITTTLWLK